MIVKKSKQKSQPEIEKKQRAAAKIFADGGYYTLQEVADRVGVHRVTLWRWWQRPEFRQLCEKERRQAVAEVKRQARAKWDRELRSLSDKLNSTDGSEALNAADSILDKWGSLMRKGCNDWRA